MKESSDSPRPYPTASQAKTTACPFAVFDLLSWRKKGKTFFYRFLHYDQSSASYYVIPMGEHPRRPDRKTGIIQWSHGEIAIHIGASLTKTDDFVVRDYMKPEYASKLTDAEKSGRDLRDRYIKPILDGSLSSELDSARDVLDVIRNSKWRKELFLARAMQIAKGAGMGDEYLGDEAHPSIDAIVGKITNAFYCWYWFGVKEAGLIPGYKERGGKGVPKSLTNTKKPGPTKEVLCEGRIVPAREQGSWCDAAWRAYFKVGIDRHGRGGTRLLDSDLYDAITGDSQLRRMLPKRRANSGEEAPRLEIFSYHRPILERELGITRPSGMVSPPPGARGGNSTDTALGREECDVDACLFEMVEIIYGDHNGNPVLATKSPTVSFAVVRKGKAILGWYTTYGSESNELYRLLMLNCFFPKDERLDELGYQGSREGIIYGPFDSIVADDGSFLKKKFPEKLIREMGFSVARTQIATPEGKGDVEGVNSVTKRFLRLVLRMLIRKFPFLIHWRHAPNRISVDRNIKARMEAKDFDLLVAKAVNTFNCQEIKAVDVDANYISANYCGFTRASLYNERKASRPGNASLPMESRSVHLRFLKRESYISHKGKVTTKYGQYRSDDLAQFEASYRRLYGIPDTEGVPIEVVRPPYGNSLKWIVDDGDIRTLEPTLTTRECHRNFTDLEQMRLRMRIEGTAPRKRRGRLTGAMLAATEEALRSTSDRYGAALKGDIPYDSSATQSLESQRRRREFGATARAVGMDMSVEHAQEAGQKKIHRVPERQPREDAEWFRTNFTDEDAERD